MGSLTAFTQYASQRARSCGVAFQLLGMSMGPVEVWQQSPPRSGKSIFATATTVGTFHRSVSTPKATRCDPHPSLPSLVEGIPVSPRSQKLVPWVHRPASVPVRGHPVNGPFAHMPQVNCNPQYTWPRHGTEYSLAFRNQWERRGAQMGYGESVSICMSPREGISAPGRRSPRR